MKTVKCINAKGTKNLTFGDEYKVIEDIKDYYKVLNDRGQYRYYRKWRFAEVE